LSGHVTAQNLRYFSAGRLTHGGDLRGHYSWSVVCCQCEPVNFRVQWIPTLTVGRFLCCFLKIWLMRRRNTCSSSAAAHNYLNEWRTNCFMEYSHTTPQCISIRLLVSAWYQR